MRDRWSILQEKSEKGEEIYVLTSIEEDSLGEAVLFTLEGTLLYGNEIPELANYVKENSYQGPACIRLRDGRSWFWQKMERDKEVLILGAGHISRCLEQQYRAIGYRCTVVDDRPEFANQGLFHDDTTVCCGPYTEVLASLPLIRFTAALVVTRGHTWDRICLHSLLPAKIPYIGMLGSRRRVEVVKKLLREEGVAEEAMKDLYAPIGLDIGSETPEEIALAIVAETLAVLRGKKGGFLCQKEESRG